MTTLTASPEFIPSVRKSAVSQAQAARAKALAQQRRFEALVRTHSVDLTRYARWLCRDVTLADDLVQEALLRAWRYVAQLREADKAKSWLITIVRREYARTFERKRVEFADVDESILADPLGDQPENNTEARLLRAAMLQLDEKYREPLLLQVIGGFSCQEIADILGITRSATMTQLFRARNQLRVQLDDDIRITSGRNDS